MSGDGYSMAQQGTREVVKWARVQSWINEFSQRFNSVLNEKLREPMPSFDDTFVDYLASLHADTDKIESDEVDDPWIH